MTLSHKRIAHYLLPLVDTKSHDITTWQLMSNVFLCNYIPSACPTWAWRNPISIEQKIVLTPHYTPLSKFHPPEYLSQAFEVREAYEVPLGAR